MRILYITPSLQHPSMHGSARHYPFIRELSRQHAITLLATTRVPATSEAIEELSSYTDRLLIFDAIQEPNPHINGKTGTFYKLAKKTSQARRNRKAVREMKKAFVELLQQEPYDLIIFHGKDVYDVIADQEDLPVVVDFCDATSMRIRSSMQFAKKSELPWLVWRYIKARRVENQMIRKSPHLSFISSRDREAILGQDGKAEVIPNMVDLQYWTRRTNNPKPNCIMYSGGMDYRPSVDGAIYLIDKILPLVRRAGHELQVLIVGRNPVPELIAAAQAYPDVVITGSVEDMRPYFEQATVYVAPLRFASGQQNKLIEAMAMEVPVVTSQVAADGMRFDGAVEPPLLVADGEEQFANAISFLLTHSEDRNNLAAAGRQYIEDYFLWSRSINVLEKMCFDAVDQRPHGLQ